MRRQGHYKKEKAVEIRNAASSYVVSVMPAKSVELKHTIQLIRILSEEIDEIKAQIQDIMEKIHSLITAIPGLGVRMAAMIISEIGDFSKCDSPNKILAFADFSPSTY